ncbi:MAG: Coenzyme F420 hydrogenase/dehydrogenase, beta subunit C-terminal domain [Pseudomonas sp.]|nr:Coenzyme F420 hydrogenase/dehydrogenase, beta subunit C-terminal domain [Pseudomonas sp.]
MKDITTISGVIKSDLCISCGACAAYKPELITLRENKKKGLLEPVVKKLTAIDEVDVMNICPGKGYDIHKLSSKKFGIDTYSSYELGLYRQLGVGFANSDRVMEKASSGGLMTAIAYYLLDKKIVDGVIVTKIIPGDKKIGPRTKTFIATNLEGLLEAQGSKYCPVPSLDIRTVVEDFDGQLAFVGTPCQIAGLELLKEQQLGWANKIIFTIGNFCGGFRDFRETDKIIERAGFRPEKVENFTYRGGGQPGRMYIQSGEKVKELNYPDYARATGFIKHKRCRYCIDATGELADISFGDAWIEKYLKSGQGWSIFVARSLMATDVINGMFADKQIYFENIGENEIIASQIGNISTKKYRQGARNKLAQLFNEAVPDFNEVNKKFEGSILFELKVLATHKIFYFLEILGLYKFISKLLKRYPQDM